MICGIAESFIDTVESDIHGSHLFAKIAGGIRFGTDRRFVCPEDTDLLLTDGFPCRSEVIRMIQIDTGQNRTVGIEHIDCIQAPPQPDFQDGHIHTRPQEYQHGSQGTEIGQRSLN